MKKAKIVVLGKLSKNVSFILQDRDNLTEESIKSSRGLVSRRKGGGGILVVRLPKKNTVKKANEGKEQGHLKEKN